MKLTLANSKAELSPSGHLVFMRGTTLMAQPFDLARLRITGEAVPIASDVGLFSVSRYGQFSVAPNGLIVYQTGGVGRSALTWLDRSGKPLGVIDDANFYQDVAISPDGKSVAATRLDPKTLHIALWITDLTRGITSRFTQEGEDIEPPAWSPDGKRIAYSTAAGVYVRDTAGAGNSERLESGEMPGWSPDGATLVTAQRGVADRGELSLLPTGGDHKSTRYLQGRASHPAFSPDRAVEGLRRRRIWLLGGFCTVRSRRPRKMEDFQPRWRPAGLEARWQGTLLHKWREDLRREDLRRAGQYRCLVRGRRA